MLQTVQGASCGYTRSLDAVACRGVHTALLLSNQAFQLGLMVTSTRSLSNNCTALPMLKTLLMFCAHLKVIRSLKQQHRYSYVQTETTLNFLVQDCTVCLYSGIYWRGSYVDISHPANILIVTSNLKTTGQY